MDKREFLRLCSAALTSPVIAPLLSWAQSEKLRNWAGNLEYSTEKLTTARSLEEAQAFVRKQQKFKVLGTRHCFNDIANSSDQFLSL
jgi:xylitol oxidase